MYFLGVVDCGYTGSVDVLLFNHDSIPYTVRRGDRIAQLIIIKIADCEIKEGIIDNTAIRGNNGFGSSGK